MVFGLGKKKMPEQEDFSSELPPPPGLGPPTNLVISMREQGFTNNQIVQALQRDGYSSDQIFDAMNQADIKSSGQPFQPASSPPSFAQQAPPAMGSQQAPDKELIEELTETIIEEKWSDIKENISRMIEWKSKTEAKVEALEKKMDQLQKSFDELHVAIVGKIGEYDRHVTEIGTDIKAMEEVFQKILPSFTQNVNELSRIVKNTKKKP